MTFRNITMLLLFIFSFQTATQGQPKTATVDLRNDELIYHNFEINCERGFIIQQYEDEYLTTAVSTDELGWTGNVDECIEGEISDLAMNRTRDRINYFRRLVGIPNGIIFVEDKNKKCQKAVLMMDAENKLDHYPTTDWKCSSDDGIQAAGKSNLSYGGHSSASVPQYIRDAGSGNGAVGHRRWILYPKAHEFGFGSTNWGTAMWVIGGNQNPETYPEFVAYPSPGYFPKPLMYPRWSFSKKGANFMGARVTMKDEYGLTVEVSTEEVVNGYGDNTIVWQPTINLYDNTNGSDHYFNVNIDSVLIGGEYTSFNYEVMAIDMVEMEPIITLIPPSCGSVSGSITLEIPAGYKKIEWSNGEVNKISLENLASGSYSVSITDKLDCTAVYNIDLEEGKEPKLLSEISGNSNASNGSTEHYSVPLYQTGYYEWSISGGTIIGDATSNEIEINWDAEASNGSLCVTFIEDDGCQSNEVCQDIDLATSNTFDIQITALAVSPNPTSALLNIHNGEGLFDQLLLSDISGKILLKMDIESTSKTAINISDFGSGIYFVKVKTEEGYAVSKVVKN